MRMTIEMIIDAMIEAGISEEDAKIVEEDQNDLFE
jgi:hypothetical protein